MSESVSGKGWPRRHDAFRAPLELVNRMIQSGDFDVLFRCLKGFRNGVVYGTRVRAPHALVLNLVWSKAPYRTIPRKVWDVTLQHALGLGGSAVTFAAVRGALERIRGHSSVLHDGLAGFMIGFVFWGNSCSNVHLQMMMYMLSRVLCALYNVVVSRANLKVPSFMYRVYMGVLWAATVIVLSVSPTALQSSMRQSLEYIFYESSRFTNWYDLLVVNSASRQ